VQVKWKGKYDKLAFPTNISLYVGNYTTIQDTTMATIEDE